MAKYTLLEVVQAVLAAGNDDIISGITDTERAKMVVRMAKDTFFYLCSEHKYPTHRQLGRLDATTTATPTSLRLPTDVDETVWIKYNKRKVADTRDKYVDLKYMTPDEFMIYTNSFDTSASNVVTATTVGGGTYLAKNDRAPEYWTSFDDDYIVCDSYDIVVDTNLQSSKTQVLYYKVPAWTETDTAVPDLPIDAFPLYLDECKAIYFATLKDDVNEKIEDRAKQSKDRATRKSWRARKGSRFNVQGRIPRHTLDRGPTFPKE